ncbi:unnamed protein product [Darwinula stevensoni]|uniref:Transporter n=1 Tax=Darwinula stevensoni TaxID=69355 RepID=A0A7R8XED4_9CRUS|nr:unnamed protein product [Darwinula stevensoni]CAG0895657.1 unnamed protein product [Darwinula stevensoni]
MRDLHCARIRERWCIRGMGMSPVEGHVEVKRDGAFLLPRNAKNAGSQEPEREQWGKKVEFLLAVIGFAVDLGNVWRFPYICYQNGGGAFLIPYVVMLVFGGLPLFYMELALGQFHHSGCITLWKRVCPMLKGVGYAICVIDIYMGMYYNTIIGWALYYLIASFTTQLPWTNCDNPWNVNCSKLNCSAYLNETIDANDTALGFGSPAQQFFDRQVLSKHLSTGISDIGDVKWDLALCLLAVFLLVYFSIWKGVRSTGVVVWFTATVPYVVLLILLVRGVTLPGSYNGIMYYLTPKWEKLKEVKVWGPPIPSVPHVRFAPFFTASCVVLQVWTDAASQIFFSLGPGFGTLIALSSYNKFHNNCYRDALFTSTVNCLTSFLAGFVIFSVLGYMAHCQGKSVEDVGKSEGPGLVFVVYPEAIASMTGSVFWSIVFFIMLITLGIDSTFGGLEAMITGLCDEYPRLLGKRRELFVAVLLVLIYLPALSTTTYGGVYVVELLNAYGPSIAILFVVFVESAGICWIYGASNFCNDITQMLGFAPSLFWRICWTCISPVFILVIFVMTLWEHENLVGYPSWANGVGWVLTASSITFIPAYILYMFTVTPGSFRQRLVKMVKPEKDSRKEGERRYLKDPEDTHDHATTSV